MQKIKMTWASCQAGKLQIGLRAVGRASDHKSLMLSFEIGLFLIDIK
jgi:hypothetical protein